MGCSSLDATLSFYIDTLGFRLELIMPADASVRIAEPDCGGRGLSVLP